MYTILDITLIGYYNLQIFSPVPQMAFRFVDCVL